MTYRELVYIVLDELKLLSDDAYYTEEHVLFLLKVYRAQLLYQKYLAEKIMKLPSDANEQEICLDLEVADPQESGCGEVYLKSVQKIPETLDLGTIKVSLSNEFRGEINYVTPRRFKHVGFNRFLKNMIYATKGNNDYLYLKSNNPQATYINKVQVTGIFEDPEEAEKYSCNSSGEQGDACDILDRQFPIEDSLSASLIKYVVADLAAASGNPKDDYNNAADDFATLMNYIRRNLKTKTQKELQNGAV